MILNVNLPDETTAALTAKARVRGLSTEEYAQQVLQQDVTPKWLEKSWETAKEAGVDQLSMDEIDAEIDAARKGRCEDRLRPGS